MNNKLFELEQEIQKCWGITSDISDYIWRQYDSVEGPMSDDESMNILMGLVAVYNMHFEKLNDVYSKAITTSASTSDDIDELPE